MNWSIGPSFRVFTIVQAVLLLGLSVALTFLVSPTRAILIIALIAAIGIALSGFTWSRKDKIPSTAAYVLGITAELSLLGPFVNHPIAVRVTGQLGLTSALDIALLDAVIIIFLGGCFITGLAFVHSRMKDLPQGWRTPLWGGPDLRKAIPLRLAS